jgi:hypothetical protein
MVLAAGSNQPGTWGIPAYGWVFSSLLLMSADHSFGAAGFAHLTP